MVIEKISIDQLLQYVTDQSDMVNYDDIVCLMMMFFETMSLSS